MVRIRLIITDLKAPKNLASAFKSVQSVFHYKNSIYRVITNKLKYAQKNYRSKDYVEEKGR